MFSMQVTDVAAQMADREAIRDCLYRYCRGSDRLDRELILSTFWPEATGDYGGFQGENAEDIVDRVVAALDGMELAKHQIGNFLIELDGDVAAIEAYSLGYKREIKPDGSRSERLTSSRYVDRMEKRGGEWRVIDRLVITDWAQDFPGNEIGKGARKPDDGSYRFLSF